MKEQPLNVVLAVVLDGKKILLINRNGGTFNNMWALPGGKIEKGEHVAEAIVREIEEEAGISCTFEEHLGIVDEIVREGEKKKHFLLHACLLTPHRSKLMESKEGKPEWFSLDELENIKEEIIPSDYLIVEYLVKNKTKNYYESVIRKDRDKYILERFV